MDLRVGGPLTDLDVLVAGTRFKVHKVIVCMSSGLICDVLRVEETDCSVEKELNLGDAPGGAATFQVFLDFAYARVCSKPYPEIGFTGIVALVACFDFLRATTFLAIGNQLLQAASLHVSPYVRMGLLRDLVSTYRSVRFVIYQV